MPEPDIDDLLKEIATQVEQEFEMGGLSAGIYFEFAAEVAKRFHAALERAEDVDES